MSFFFSLQATSEVGAIEAFFARPSQVGAEASGEKAHDAVPDAADAVHLEAWYGEDGELADTPDAVGAALRSEWAPLCKARPNDERGMRRFDDFVVEAAGFGPWEWRRS